MAIVGEKRRMAELSGKLMNVSRLVCFVVSGFDYDVTMVEKLSLSWHLCLNFVGVKFFYQCEVFMENEQSHPVGDPRI